MPDYAALREQKRLYQERRRASNEKILRVVAACAAVACLLYAIYRWDKNNAAEQLEAAKHRPDTSSYNPTRICPDAIDHDEDHSAFQGRSFKVTMKEGCFGPFVRMPKAWRDWHTQADGDEEHYWIAAWTNASKTPTRPFGAFADVNLGVYSAVRLQGHGTVIFYTPQF